MPELAERLGLDLPDPLASDLEVLPHLFEGVVALLPDPEALVMPLVGCGDGRPPVLGSACARPWPPLLVLTPLRCVARERGSRTSLAPLGHGRDGRSTGTSPRACVGWG